MPHLLHRTATSSSSIVINTGNGLCSSQQKKKKVRTAVLAFGCLLLGYIIGCSSSFRNPYPVDMVRVGIVRANMPLLKEPSMIPFIADDRLLQQGCASIQKNFPGVVNHLNACSHSSQLLAFSCMKQL
jgi:hypothetical protein